MAKEDSLVFEVSAVDTASRVFAQVGASAKDLQKSYASLRSAFEAIGVGLSGAAFIAMTKSAADAADAAAKMGDRFGIATETMIGMQHAADLAGVSTDGLTNALRGIAKSGVDAAMGNEKARTAFERLHIQASEFIKLPMDEQLSLIVDRLGKMENAAVRNATAQALMGKNAGQMMGLVAEGSEAIAKATADTEAWGLAINRIDAAKIEIANSALKDVHASTMGLFTQIAVHLSPTVVELARQFTDAKKEAHGFRDEISYLDDGLKAVASLALAAKDIFFGLGHQIGAVGAAVAALFRGEFKAAYTIIEEANADVLQHTIETNAKIDAVWKTSTTSLDEEAKKVAKRRQEMNKEGGDPGVAPFDHYKAALAQQLGALIEHNRNELAVVQANYDQKQALLDESVAKGIITDDFWQGQSMLLYAQYQDSLTKIQDEELKKRYGISNVYHQLDLASTSAWLGQLGAMMSSHNRAAFEIGKAAAISQTIIDTYRAAQGAFAAFAGIPYVGPALGAAAAAAAIVAGLARVQQIRSTSFGGGGGVSGGAAPVFSANPTTGVPTAPIVPQAPAPAGGGQVVNITIEGNVTQDILDQLKELFGNDGVLIGPNSRQASVITQGI